MKTWKPSKKQKREFAEKMQNPEFAAAYYERKRQREEKRRSNSKFDYNSAGGYFAPSILQVRAAKGLLNSDNEELRNAAEAIYNADLNASKVHHDYIHIINEWLRSGNHSLISL